MKKIIYVLVCLIIIFTISIGNSSVKSADNENLIQYSIENKIIRFHVIANSDTSFDQALKLKVRDEVLKYINPKLKNSKSIEQSRNILKANDEKIKQIAESVIKSNGYNYSVNTTLSKENFPIKTYGNITLPQGEYEAYRIIIGNGKGQNWWCVMFPPLCFIDINKGEVAYKETESTMKKVLSEEEYNAIDNQKTDKNKDLLNKDKEGELNKEKGAENGDKIIIKFKIVEVFNDIFKK
ncbi:stage II sporulation protein R [Clostridium sp. USBA 49]|jgi:stage II sporulation protein R|uniref:stage II sporulation protein R n=1 Tax=Clostridium TaxID=1485 RepID=UPI00099AEFB3|nr:MULTISPECIES: stage II sporulation protein R [Clostridium]SKA81408.1 stage II sporulation protein R [Clostridium sp. USBA 49]